MKRLESGDYRYMKRVAKKMSARKDIDFGFPGKGFPEVDCLADYMKKTNMSWEDFYAYLATGYMKPGVEDVLREEFPRTYRIYREVKERSEL